MSGVVLLTGAFGMVGTPLGLASPLPRVYLKRNVLRPSGRYTHPRESERSMWGDPQSDGRTP